MTVSNPGHAMTAVSWKSSNPAVEVLPADSSIAAGCEEQFQVQIRGSDVGQLQAQLLCLVKHGSCQAIEVAATVAGKFNAEEAVCWMQGSSLAASMSSDCALLTVHLSLNLDLTCNVDRVGCLNASHAGVPRCI